MSKYGFFFFLVLAPIAWTLNQFSPPPVINRPENNQNCEEGKKERSRDAGAFLKQHPDKTQFNIKPGFNMRPLSRRAERIYHAGPSYVCVPTTEGERMCPKSWKITRLSLSPLSSPFYQALYLLSAGLICWKMGFTTVIDHPLATIRPCN